MALIAAIIELRTRVALFLLGRCIFNIAIYEIALGTDIDFRIEESVDE